MLFNTIDFGIFLPIVFLLYWCVFNKNLKTQNSLLLLSSLIFYGWWDYRFLFLLIFSTLLDFFSGLKISEAKSLKGKRIWFWLSIGINLGFLGFFKYYNFFIESFAEFFTLFGFHFDLWTLKVILPVGISFYTFHGMSYVIDVYHERIKPVRSYNEYSVFVSFFPLLVAGPIERATHLLPQIQNQRTFNYNQSIDGLRQIIWGLFKKVVIADNCAEFVNKIFENYSEQSASTLLLGAFLFSIQIYGDFSGYSEIARGTAKLFGFNLLRNFAFPYFSRDIAEFWRRWHISLSSWFRDYLYIPLGGSKTSKWLRVRNTLIIFIVSGFWHGANWTFIAWGLLNALFILPLIVFSKNRNNLEIVAKGKYLPSLKECLFMVSTFLLVTIAWIFFRSESLHMAIDYVSKMVSISLFSFPSILPIGLLFAILVCFIIEWFGRESEFALTNLNNAVNPVLRVSFYYMLIFVIFYFAGEEQQFIYFQF